MIKNEMPAYELISGALIGIGAIFFNYYQVLQQI